VKERPILFSAPMVRALLDGSKTQTRRVVKLPHENALGQWESTTIGGELGGRTVAGDEIPVQGAIWHTRTGDCLVSPYGQPGDRLWIRESGVRSLLAGGGDLRGLFRHDVPETPETGRYWVESTRAHGASYNVAGCSRAAALCSASAKVTPSIHMPRWASRILLEIVSVRVERLNHCSATDARAEGLISYEHFWRDSEYPLPDIAFEPFEGSPVRYSDPVAAYAALWESINGDGSWATNPFVWVISFKRVAP
jgi:hypothetical protein